MKLRRIILVAVVALLCLASCEKEDPFVPTDSAKNTLGFMLNGKKVEYLWQPPFYISDADPQHVKAREYNDTLEIYASLTGGTDVLDGLEHISIILPVSKLVSGAVLDNVAEIYVPYIAGREKEDNVTHLHGKCLDITTSRVGIRTCKRGEVISGTFECEGDAEFDDGTKKHYSITNGNFDVKWDILSNFQSDEQ